MLLLGNFVFLCNSTLGINIIKSMDKDSVKYVFKISRARGSLKSVLMILMQT